MPSLPGDLAVRHLARIVDSSDDAIISKDLNGTIMSWNAAAERMFGYPAEEAIGRSIRMIIPADRQQEEDFVLGRIRAGQSVSHYETVRQRKDGTTLPISLTVSPIRDDHGVVVGASKIVRDISERVRLTAAVEERALENARLYEEAREADRLKDEFLAVLSHELRTPLSAIVGYARLLRSGLLTGEKAEKGLETLERNAAALTQIIEDVLDISRIVSGKIRLDVQPVDIALVVHNAMATVQPAADARGVRMQTMVDSGVGAVSGDPGRLQQVVWNLLSNAVKFTPREGRVQVRVERVNSHVEIVVSDTGIGIRPEFLPHIFERFRQADAGMTRKTGGLGLGLSIVRQIVEMHGGSVEAESGGEGRGTTVRVQLPLMIVHQPRTGEAREHPRTEQAEPLSALTSLAGVRVLSIDDDGDALGLLRIVLETAGAEVVTMSSPAAALPRIADIKPDALIVDLGMPEMDGYEFIRRLRASADPSVRELPAAALTAFARSEDRTKVLRSGFQMHLAKPIDPAELVASVATLVKRTRV
ncbi:MAG TPA: ATP-binding protein [Vicinamibacterales bacterium]|nr:ATP-binding protein [Vicinamibacterales bacterium]